MKEFRRKKRRNKNNLFEVPALTREEMQVLLWKMDMLDNTDNEQVFNDWVDSLRPAEQGYVNFVLEQKYLASIS